MPDDDYNFKQQMQKQCLVALLLFLKLLSAEMQFKTSDYFAAHQVRLHPTLTSSLFIYTLPVQPILTPTSAAMALSGYDFAPNTFLSFSVQLSYDADANSYQIVFKTENGTQVYLINYFLIEVGQSASNWIVAQSFCFNSSNPSVLNLIQYCNFNASFVANPNDNTKVIPYINSASLFTASNPNFYLNVALAQIQNKTTNVNLQIHRNNSYLVSACVTIILVKEAFLSNQPRIAYYFQPQYTIKNDGQSLSAAAAKQFGLSYYYGPIIEPKCVVAFRSFLINGSSRQSLSFDLSQPAIISINSEKYMIDFAQLCIGYVSCPIQSYQFYPMIGDCQPACSIDNCLSCSSSTSCLTCNVTYFIDPIKRCSPCIINCLTCNDSKSCITCGMGFYYANSMCQQCPIYCLNCTTNNCFSCADGYTPNNTNCVSCQVPMPRCLKCTSSSTCTICVDTYVYYSNQAACVSCKSLMPNCLLCNWPNNCLTCMPNFYLYSFYQCYPCSYKIPQCCQNYVANCSICASNTSCSNCQMGWFVNSNQTCSACSNNWNNCQSCDNTTCSACNKGYFLTNNTCVQCSSMIANCKICTNSSYCQQCTQPLIFGDGKCINCPVWPINDLYYLDKANGSICHPCAKIDTYCSSCSLDGTCLACREMFYLHNGSCYQCQRFMPFCIDCRIGEECVICQNGYFLNISNKKQCLQCRIVLENCLSCQMKFEPRQSNVVYSCSICSPEYYSQQGLCLPCNISLSNCLQCSDAKTCKLCAMNFFPSNNGLCLGCSELINGCLNCSTSSKCIQCAEGYINQGAYCTSCNSLIPNCRICGLSKQTNCQQCVQGYFIDQNFSCQNCSKKYQYCTGCGKNGCNTCISSFFASSDGVCVRCDSLIANCSYCDNSMQCRGCAANYILYMQTNQCRSCFQIQAGCLTCDQIQIGSTDIICKSCATDYLPNTVNNLFNCIYCGQAILHCKTCASLTQCLECHNNSFPNQGKCSLCVLYFENCQICSNISTCQKCVDGYAFDGNNSCVSCEWAKLGMSGSGDRLCLQCGFKNGNVQCVKCNQSGYLQQGKCMECGSLINNCIQCVGVTNCSKCIKGYYLSLSWTECLRCKMQNCRNCSQTSCYTCYSGYFLSTNQCLSCSSVIPNCNICLQNGCAFCIDGYYLYQSTCISCSTISTDCVVCDGPNNCLVSTPYSEVNRNIKIVKGLSIAGITGLAIIIGLLVVYFVRWRMARRQEEQDMGSDTSRRMRDGQNFSKDVEIQRNLCEQCKLRKVEQIKLELLCYDCDQIENRGNKHKISQTVGKQAKDCVIESLQIESNLEEKNSPIEKQNLVVKDNNDKVEQSSKPTDNLSPRLAGSSNTKNINSSNQKFSYRGQSTKAETIQKSRFYRDMF